MKKNIFFFALIAIALSVFVVPFFVSAQTQITANIPGTYSVATQGPGAFVGNLYEFALMIGGVLAFGVIVYGGVKYMTSAGNPSGQSDAKEWIEAALLGLLLLGGAYFVLYVINPQLVNLTLPPLQTLNITGPTGGPGPGNGTTATGCVGDGCQSLSDDGFACKAASQQPNGQSSCSASQDMVDTLECIQNIVGQGDFTVTEAMPPTVPHQSKCHQDGCCVDTALNNPTCDQINALVNAAITCHTTAADEYAGCAGSKIYPTTTGGNVHINGVPGNGC